jgi:acyl-coenzyme A synthetase/AMP-(fatty) acid ligase
VSQLASLSYDISLEEVVLALGSGATLALGPTGPLGSSREFLAWCDARRLSVLIIPTALFHQLVADLAAPGVVLPRSLRLVQVGGEAVVPEAIAQWHIRGGGSARLVNTYGPTEATVMSTWCELDAATGALPVAPIGRPFPGVRVLVLDSALQAVAPGVPGEAFIGGSGVARGYLRRPELTAERFVPDPSSGVPGARLFRTGDRVRWRHDGRLEFLGRLDRQVKIRGHRVEPGEVEAALARHPGLRQSAVSARKQPDGETCLVAYLVPAARAELRVEEVRAFLASRLPEFMVPSRFVVVDELPVNLAGKIQTGALPLPEAAPDHDGGPPTLPRTPLEREVAAVWSAVLGREAIGVHENFFAIGGHSLKVMQVVARLHRRLGLEVPVKVFFEAPTIEGLAEALETLLWLRDTQLSLTAERDRTAGAK